MMKFTVWIFLLLIGTPAFAGKPHKTVFYTDGTPQAEYYRLGQRSLRVVFYYEDGAIRETGFYKNGKLHGQWVSYWPDGSVNCQATFIENDRFGRWRFWDKRGNLEGTLAYEDNQLIGFEQFFESPVMKPLKP